MSAFQKGAIIVAKPLDVDEALSIMVTSSRPIGQGATSLVYAGQTTELTSMGDITEESAPGRPVAMKVFHVLVPSEEERDWAQVNL
ncbi:hypothetical protein AURDEDRAFT_116569 [Auricularia subglabra TFB-10046 SS5]|nr:hypothetical protein AURDEDRAFT_116569 [Auricularia subglabra TFB-10046 SS5]